VIQKVFRLCLYLSYLHLKQDLLNFEFCQIKLGVEVESQTNLQSIGNISLKLDSNLSLLLEYGRKIA